MRRMGSEVTCLSEHRGLEHRKWRNQLFPLPPPAGVSSLRLSDSSGRLSGCFSLQPISLPPLPAPLPPELWLRLSVFLLSSCSSPEEIKWLSF